MSAHPSEQPSRCLVCGQMLANESAPEIVRIRSCRDDLVAALELCVGHIEEANGRHPEDHPVNDCPVLNTARAALKRAKEE